MAQEFVVDQHTMNEGAVMSTRKQYEKMFAACAKENGMKGTAR